MVGYGSEDTYLGRFRKTKALYISTGYVVTEYGAVGEVAVEYDTVEPYLERSGRL